MVCANLSFLSTKVVYCDETAFMDIAIFYEGLVIRCVVFSDQGVPVILPLFEMKNCTLICISSLVDSYNFYTALINLRHPDTSLPICNTYQCSLVCDRCKKRTKPEKCTHNDKYIPPWKSKEKNKIVRVILKDMVHILKRESLYVYSVGRTHSLIGVWYRTRAMD